MLVFKRFMLLNDSGNDIEAMVDSRKAFDPTTTAFHTGFHQAETHRIVDPSTEKQMKQSAFLFPRSLISDAAIVMPADFWMCFLNVDPLSFFINAQLLLQSSNTFSRPCNSIDTGAHGSVQASSST